MQGRGGGGGGGGCLKTDGFRGVRKTWGLRFRALGLGWSVFKATSLRNNWVIL